ncbi:hypothetical protein CKO15_10285 [Halorhodospira abdelmalekii]|uniref:beta-ketoacyl-ACP synthase III n=1 Tax=Halorhodospira abdelmalekii TaxID=421629 RepID=UPI001903081D|nr:beta-ketoacyl-ACP synthase III [Halorhodospira abdelmalekii]MBK1735664.1 hypothetical protein [Halorhodospira abdelmalekii]
MSSHTAAYITGAGAFLPNAPVANEQMEALLGQLGARPSRTRRIILRNNGIVQRHYALDPQSGALTHTNAGMTAAAVRELFDTPEALEQIELLCCGTSSPDQLMPNHAAMVHGELASHCLEVVATSGICMAGVAALKYAWLAVRSGEYHSAVATGSEHASSFMRAHFLRAALKEESHTPDELDKQPELAFEAEFLRWMLSDGAGALLLQSQPRPTGISLRLDWIDSFSFAHELEPCMYAGAEKRADGSLRGWREHVNWQELVDSGLLAVKQDVKLLNDQVVPYCLGEGLARSVIRRGIDPETIGWFLPHYSSEWFRDKVSAEMTRREWLVPQQRWFTNLHTRGNTGSAALYLMLEELIHSDRLRPGQRLLCFVPESGRFSSAFIHLTAVTEATP